MRPHGKDYSAASLGRMAGDLAAAGSGAGAGAGRCVLWAEGEIRRAAIFAEHLRLTRRIEADLSIGWPLLEEGARR